MHCRFFINVVIFAVIAKYSLAIQIDRFTSDQPAGRDYVYTLFEVRPDPKRHPNLGYLGGDPFNTHRLDARSGTFLAGAFHFPPGAKEFRGIAIKASRDGWPGAIEVRYGTAPGKNDLGIATISPDTVLPLYEIWIEAPVKPCALAENTIVYWESRALAGKDPEDHYLIYGPRLNNASSPFLPSYRVLTDREIDRLTVPGKQYTFQHVKKLLGPYYTDDPALRLQGKPAGDNETAIENGWQICYQDDAHHVISTAARDLQQFLSFRANVKVQLTNTPPQSTSHIIHLVVSNDAEFLRTINTEEGYRITVEPERIIVCAQHPRGIMRGIYWLEEMMRFRGAACLKRGTTDRNCLFRRRMVTSISIAELSYDLVSYPLIYTDGLLQRISHQGFNTIWFYLNIEEITFDSKVFPELNDPETPRRLARLKDLVDRAKPLGIDVIPHFTTYHHRPIPESFYAKYPDCRGVGWGNALCTSHPKVQRYLDESIRKLFQAVPGLKGLDIIFDCEGFYHCAIGPKQNCPRCRNRKTTDIVVEFLTIIHKAMKDVDPESELIAWSYGGSSYPHFTPWAEEVLVRLPKGIIFQAEFAKGTPIVRDGVKHVTEDYNITAIGPPPHFLQQYNAARKAGVPVIVKTEHAISQEFITVPYIPCMRQWYNRISKMAEYDLYGYMANWNHYGYMPSRPAEIMMWYSWNKAPEFEELIHWLAVRDFGEKAAPHVLQAWDEVTEGIRLFPYSDPIARYPGPLQKGPSQPLFLDPAIKNFGWTRSWQNDLNWTRPWGPDLAAKYLKQVEERFAKAIEHLQKGRTVATEAGQIDLDGEIRIVETMRCSLHTMLNLIRWIPLRNAYAKATTEEQKQQLRKQLIEIAKDELENARFALKITEADSRLGASSEAAGSRRGGLFTPALIRIKIEMLEKVLEQLSQTN